MKQFIFATESYPLTTDVRDLLSNPDDRAVLLTKDVHLSMNEDQLRRFDQVVVVPTFDTPTLKRALTEDIRPEPGARIVSHDDFFYEIFARLNEDFGLAGYSRESILPFVDKNVMKQRLLHSGIRIPRYVMFDSAEYAADRGGYVARLGAELRFPIFAKPINEAGAENTALIADTAELRAWCEAHPGVGNYELDEFIGDADLYHCDSIIQHGRAVFTQVAKYSRPCADFAKGEAVGSYTLEDSEPLVDKLRRFASYVIDAFRAHHPVPDGVTHMEVFHTYSDELVFLEVQFRPPGANVRVAYQQHLEINLERFHYLLQMGKPVRLPTASGPYAAWMYFPTADGTVREVLPLPALHSEVVEAGYSVEPGKKTQLPRSILDAKGRGVVALSLVVSCPSYAHIKEDFEMLMRHRPYSMCE